MNTNHEPNSETRVDTANQRGKTWRWWLSGLASSGLLFVAGLTAGLLCIVFLGIAQRAGWLIAGSETAGSSSQAQVETSYTCAMHPQIRQPKGTRCPLCDMDLVPTIVTDNPGDSISVMIPQAKRRLANIQTAPVKFESLNRIIRTIGAIEVDESRQATIASYIDGRVERLFADYTGILVAKGDHLAVVYSPQLYGAQVEYIESGKALARMTPGTLAAIRQTQTKLVANSHRKLVELGMTDQQLDELEKTGIAQARLTIHSPLGGTVTGKMTQAGKYLKAGEPIYQIANLSTVWLMLKLYPEDASQIRFGQLVKAEVASLPGEILEGRIAFIDPVVDELTRTVGVRVEFDNSKKNLRPGDYARATINVPIGSSDIVYDKELAGKWISPMHPQIIRDVAGDCPICGMKLVSTAEYGYSETPVEQSKSISIPRSAVLMAGENSIVYVETDPGRFEIRRITLGSILRDRVIVLAGIAAGEQVATAGNFLIDSEMQLAGNPSLIDVTRVGITTAANTALKFSEWNFRSLQGVAGVQLEELYQAYFDIQQRLTSDQQPDSASASALHELSTLLSDSKTSGWTDEEQQFLVQISKHSGRLHDLSVPEARIEFQSISQAILPLATKVRGAGELQPFYHFFCPLVKEGQGDWLQANDQPRNPYLGTAMPRCGELIHTFEKEAQDDKSGEGK